MLNDIKILKIALVAVFILGVYFTSINAYKYRALSGKVASFNESMMTLPDEDTTRLAVRSFIEATQEDTWAMSASAQQRTNTPSRSNTITEQAGALSQFSGIPVVGSVISAVAGAVTGVQSYTRDTNNQQQNCVSICGVKKGVGSAISFFTGGIVRPDMGKSYNVESAKAIVRDAYIRDTQTRVIAKLNPLAPNYDKQRRDALNQANQNANAAIRSATVQRTGSRTEKGKTTVQCKGNSYTLPDDAAKYQACVGVTPKTVDEIRGTASSSNSASTTSDKSSDKDKNSSGGSQRSLAAPPSCDAQCQKKQQKQQSFDNWTRFLDVLDFARFSQGPIGDNWGGWAEPMREQGVDLCVDALESAPGSRSLCTTAWDTQNFSVVNNLIEKQKKEADNSNSKGSNSSSDSQGEKDSTPGSRQRGN